MKCLTQEDEEVTLDLRQFVLSLCVSMSSLAVKLVSRIIIIILWMSRANETRIKL